MKNVEVVHRQSQHNAASACAYCMGVQGHESWCATCDPNVNYAYQIVLDPLKITLGDSLILHSLGVTWSDLAKR